MIGDGSTDLPFERNGEPFELDLSDGLLSGGVVVMAATTPLPDETVAPTLVFRFARANGSGFYPPVVLLAEDEAMAKLRPLILEAVHAARERAKAENAKRNGGGARR